MITAQTLVGLACLLSNGGPTDQAHEVSLTESQKQQMEELIYQEPCLPENFETLIKQSEEKMKVDGKPTEVLGMPTLDCFQG